MSAPSTMFWHLRCRSDRGTRSRCLFSTTPRFVLRRAWVWAIVIFLHLLVQRQPAAGGQGREPIAPPAAPQATIWRTKLATDVTPEETVWDSSALEGNYDLLDFTFDATSDQVTWTLRNRPRVKTYRDFYVTLYDSLGRPLVEAPLAWSRSRRQSGTVHLASLDLAWLSRRLDDRTKDIAMVAVQRYDAREYGRPRAMAPREQRVARLRKQFAPTFLPESIQWDHAGFESCYEVLDTSLDTSSGHVVWQLEPLPRTYPSRAFRAVCYDAAGKPMEELPLLWSDGRSERRTIALAELDVGYLAESLKERAQSVARVTIERYEN